MDVLSILKSRPSWTSQNPNTDPTYSHSCPRGPSSLTLKTTAMLTPDPPSFTQRTLHHSPRPFRVAPYKPLSLTPLKPYHSPYRHHRSLHRPPPGSLTSRNPSSHVPHTVLQTPFPITALHIIQPEGPPHWSFHMSPSLTTPSRITQPGPSPWLCSQDPKAPPQDELGSLLAQTGSASPEIPFPLQPSLVGLDDALAYLSQAQQQPPSPSSTSNKNGVTRAAPGTLSPAGKMARASHCCLRLPFQPEEICVLGSGKSP